MTRQNRRTNRKENRRKSSRPHTNTQAQNSNSTWNSRISRVLFVLFLLLIVVFLRLFYLQVVKAGEYSDLAQTQRTRDLTLYAKRGTIFDRSGNVLAKSVDVETIYANPKEIKDPVAAGQALVNVIGGDQIDITNKLNNKDKSFVYLSKKADETLVSQVKDLNIEGVHFLPDTKRIYPYGQVAGQIIGAVGTDNEGLSGLEMYYDDILSGKNGELLVERGRNGYPIPNGVKKMVQAQNGEDIVLSIDINIQREAETRMAEATKDWGAISSSAVVLNPKTGEILAMCSTPFLNPNNLSSAPAAALKLRPISEVYEPGSTFKALTAAFAVDAGVANINKNYTVPPSIKVGDHSVKDVFEHGYIDLTLREILIHSSNIGAVMMARDTGSQKFWEYLNKFELNKPTGIDFAGESKGILKDIDNWDGSSLGSMAFGQGISLTPIQLTRAIAAIADDGLLRQPHFLVSRGGENVKYPEPKRVISSASSDQIADAMESVVSEGTGKAGQIPGFAVSAKTGTAQRVTKRGGYAEGFNTASFVGFAPTNNPEVVVYTVVDGMAGYGSSAAGPAFRNIMAMALKQLDISPDDAKRFNEYEKEQEQIDKAREAEEKSSSEATKSQSKESKKSKDSKESKESTKTN